MAERSRDNAASHMLTGSGWSGMAEDMANAQDHLPTHPTARFFNGVVGAYTHDPCGIEVPVRQV